MNLVLPVSLICASLFADGGAVDPKQFFEGITGTYLIDSVQGLPPHADDRTASVGLSATEAILMLPYREKSERGFSDPGYLAFPWESTTVEKTIVGPESVSYLISLDTNSALGNIPGIVLSSPTYSYTWHDEAGSVTFRNHQYNIPDGNDRLLEFKLTKAVRPTAFSRIKRVGSTIPALPLSATSAKNPYETVRVYISTDCALCAGWKNEITGSMKYDAAAFEGRVYPLWGSNGVMYLVHWAPSMEESEHLGSFPSLQLPPGVQFR